MRMNARMPKQPSAPEKAQTAEKSDSSLLQQEKAKAALDWLTNNEDRRLLLLHFGLEGESACTHRALAAGSDLSVSQIAAKLKELLEPAHYMRESIYIEQRERAWQIYPYVPLSEGEFLRELFVFYGPQRAIDFRQFVGAKISWGLLKQRIEQGVNGQTASEGSSRCDLEEHDFLFQKIANPQLPMPTREVIARVWRRMNLLEQGITILSFGLAGRREHNPKEIARMLMRGQPIDVDKVRGLLCRIKDEALRHSREAKGWA